MSREKRFYRVVIGDLPDYEELVAFIYISDKSLSKLRETSQSILLEENEYHVNYINSEEIAMVHTEEGRDKMKIRFSKYASKNDLDLDEVIKAIDKAKKMLSN